MLPNWKANGSAGLKKSLKVEAGEKEGSSREYTNAQPHFATTARICNEDGKEPDAPYRFNFLRLYSYLVSIIANFLS